jgi:hypothetical protein
MRGVFAVRRIFASSALIVVIFFVRFVCFVIFVVIVSA